MRATDQRLRTGRATSSKGTLQTPMLSSTIRRSVARASQLAGANLWAVNAARASPWQPATAQRRGLIRTHVTIQEGAAAGSPRVVILGGGFGGLYTAVRLASLFWPKNKVPQVTLIDQSEQFVFKPLLYELLNGTATENEVAPAYTNLLAPYPVRFIQGKVVGAEPEELLRDGGSASGGTVQLAGGNKVEYDYLVVALGAKSDDRGLPGVREHTVPFNTFEDAIKTREALADIESRGQGTVAVVGGGYAGVELACVIAERMQNKGLGGQVRVRIVTPGQSILSSSPAGQRAAAEEVLAKLGVEVDTGSRVYSVGASSSEGALPTAAVINLDDRPTFKEDMQQAAANMADAAAKAASGFADKADATADALRSEHANANAASSSSGSAHNGTSAANGNGANQAEQNGGSKEYEGPRNVPADLVVWTAGSSPATKVVRKGFPFPTNPKGSVRTDSTLRVMSHARVFALGDVCMAAKGYVQDAPGRGQQELDNTSSFPATAQVAFQQADYVAWNVWAAIMGRPLLPFRYQHLGSMMSLGSFNAAVELPLPVPSSLQSSVQASPLGPLLDTIGIKLSPADKPDATGGVTLDGPLAALMRRAAYLYRQPTDEQRMSVAAEWLAQASEAAQAALANLQQQQSTR